MPVLDNLIYNKDISVSLQTQVIVDLSRAVPLTREQSFDVLNNCFVFEENSANCTGIKIKGTNDVLVMTTFSRVIVERLTLEEFLQMSKAVNPDSHSFENPPNDDEYLEY